MNRKNFLKGLGLVGAGLTIPTSKLLAGGTGSNSCVLIPTETAGPFPLDLTENTTFFRSNIREDRAGVSLNVKIKVIGSVNCLPLQNVRVNIWHCDKDGLYSGYDTTNNLGQSGKTYCRGYQMTDANGEVNFTTIFPGWYSGRICHIHFQVYVSSSYAAISQLTFPLDAKNAIYSNNSSLYTKGSDPLTFSSDNIFSDGYQYQLASLTANSSGGYDSSLEVTVQGTGATASIGHQEKENAKQFTLSQNFPNPYSQETTIPFSLLHPSDVRMEIWDLDGRKLATLIDQKLSTGEHSIVFDPPSINMSVGNYIYQLEVVNENGVFRDAKMITAAR